MNGLDSDQQRAVDMALNEEVLVITGGPGVGKTFTTNHILDALDLPYSKVALAAPTGKAARRMSEATFGREAQTIHRLLEYSPITGGFLRNDKQPLSKDLVIIDESSMLDTRLAASLFQAIKPEARLILVGDKDQLPSVGPGNVFRDLIKSKVLPVAELTQIHRQSEHSWIPVNARRINQGQAIELDPKSEDFFVLFSEEPQGAREKILELITEMIPARHGLNPLTDVQLLCPQKKGALGVFELNEELQNLLNPPRDGEASYRGFRPRDKVIHMRNNYILGVMNGECGSKSSRSRSRKESRGGFRGPRDHVRRGVPGRPGPGLRHDYPQIPGLRVALRGHSHPLVQLIHAQSQPFLHRSDPRQGVGLRGGQRPRPFPGHQE